MKFSFMTKRGSLIGIKNMTIKDCTKDNMTPDELLVAQEEAWFRAEMKKLSYVEQQLFESNWKDFKYQRTIPTKPPTTAPVISGKGSWNVNSGNFK